MIHFPNAKVEIRRLGAYSGVTETDTGEEMAVSEATPETKCIAADIQPYSSTTDGGVFLNYPEMKEGLYYRIFLPLNPYTVQVRVRDTIKVISAPGYPELVGALLGVEKKSGRTITGHVQLLVRSGHDN